MLPGFRFLFAAIILSMSLLVFELGAAALLRAAHEEFASNPSWRATPEVMFAQPAEASRPVLAMLRVDVPAAERVQDAAPAATAPAEQTATTSAPVEPERLAAVEPGDPSGAETAKAETAATETPVAENPAPSETAPVSVEIPASADETRVATIATSEVSSHENQAAAAASEPIVTQVTPGADIDIAATKIATLGGPPVSIAPPAKVGDAKADKPDESAVRKREQARREAQRRRLAAERARLAGQPFAQPAYPFGQPAPAIRTR